MKGNLPLSATAGEYLSDQNPAFAFLDGSLFPVMFACLLLTEWYATFVSGSVGAPRAAERCRRRSRE